MTTAYASRYDRRGAAERPVIAVVWHRRQRRPVAFVWRRRRFSIRRVLNVWVIHTGWWDTNLEVHRVYWRVRAEGRDFELSFDRIARRWHMERVLN